ncbi:hypothetical protein D1872_50560 [compost metagenome]
MADNNLNTIRKNMDVKVSMDVKEALRSVNQLERQASKLGDLADQGKHRQGGFLSPKQVDLYRKITKEIEETYQQHYKRLQDMQEQHNKKISKAQQALAKHQEALLKAQGANKWGDVASPRIVDYHERKIFQAQKELNGTKEFEASIARMKEAVDQLDTEKLRAMGHSQRIDSMHEMSPKTRHAIQGMVNSAVSAGGVTSIGALINYMGNGKDLIRDRETYARMIAQKGDYEGSDRDNIKAIIDSGLKMGYDSLQTVSLQASLIQGGTQNQQQSLKDVETAQAFSRAYSVRPEELSDGFGVLRRMGTLEEGEMKRFADLIGGAIKANSMNGREEEMLRSATMLISSVSQGMTELSQNQVGNIMALQATLGEAIPSLKGEKGAALLGGIDAAIKAQDPNGDILLGKGSKYAGIEGIYELEMRKAEGLSNPDNLQDLLSNISNNFVGEEYQQLVLRDWVNNRGGSMTLPQAKALMDSGMWDQVASGQTQLTQEQLAQFGMIDQTQKLESYSASDTATRQVNTAMEDARKQNVADEWEDAGTWIMEQFNNMPEWAQKASVIGGGIVGGAGGLLIGNKIKNAVFGGLKTVKPTIGGASAAGSFLSNLWSKVTGGGGPKGGAGGAGGMVTSVADDALKATGSLWSKLGAGAKWLGGRVVAPVATIAAYQESTKVSNEVLDYLTGHSAGDVKSETLLSNPFTVETFEEDRPSALLEGHKWISGKLNDWFGMRNPWDEMTEETTPKGVSLPTAMQNTPGILWDNFMKDLQGGGSTEKPDFGKQANQNKALLEGAKAMKSEYSQSKEIDQAIKSWDAMWDKSLIKFSKKLEETSPTINQEHVLKIVLEGDIKGVTPQTEQAVKDTIKQFFSLTNPLAAYGFSLAMDQTRK